jgi:hypothetical protein
MNLTVREYKKFFFDRKLVMDKMGEATRRALSKAGAFIRTRARTSIRKRKKISKPGSPPSSHVGTLKKLLFFGYDPSAKSVVVGPAAFGKAEAPSLLEFGGQVKRATRRGRKTMVYRPRPFMGPALQREVEAGTIPKQWQNAIRGNG